MSSSRTESSHFLCAGGGGPGPEMATCPQSTQECPHMLWWKQETMLSSGMKVLHTLGCWDLSPALSTSQILPGVALESQNTYNCDRSAPGTARPPSSSVLVLDHPWDWQRFMAWEGFLQTNSRSQITGPHCPCAPILRRIKACSQGFPSCYNQRNDPA